LLHAVDALERARIRITKSSRFRKSQLSINGFASEWPFKASKFYTFGWNNLADYDAGT